MDPLLRGESLGSEFLYVIDCLEYILGSGFYLQVLMLKGGVVGPVFFCLVFASNGSEMLI